MFPTKCSGKMKKRGSNNNHKTLMTLASIDLGGKFLFNRSLDFDLTCVLLYMSKNL